MTSRSDTAVALTRRAQFGRNLVHHGPLSDVDRAIIKHLQEDGRRSFVTIARDVGVTEKTVRNRVRYLLSNNIVQIVALTTPSALGYKAGALAAISSDPTVPASRIAAELAAIDDLDYIVVTTGRYSLFAEIITRDMPSMQRVVEQQIGKIAGVRGVEIFPYFSLYYQKARFFTIGEQAWEEPGVRHQELDDIDKAIARELSYDGRAPLRNVAEKLSISETQVRTRIQAMVSSGTMSILAIANPMNLRNRAIAWVAIKATGKTGLRELADRVAKISFVTYIAICAGRFDIFAEFVCSSSDELLDAIDEKLRKVDGVQDIETFMYLDLHYKRLVPVRGGDGGAEDNHVIPGQFADEADEDTIDEETA
jgi:DNA-binding Lrp family transcriptional regulator